MRIITDKLGSIVDGVTGKEWSKEKLGKEVNKRSVVLRNLKIGRGDKILILHGGTPSFFADLLSIWNMGACAICANPDLTKSEVRVISTFVKPKLILVAENYNDDLNFKILNLSEQTKKNNSNDGSFDIDSRIDDDALILFTSGTTGTPKGVVHTFRSLLSRLSLNQSRISNSEMRVTLSPLPTYFGHGLIGNSLTPLLSGNKLILIPGNDMSIVSKLGNIIDHYGVTFLSSVPSMWKIVTKISRPPSGKSLKRVHVGSAPLSSDAWRKIIKWSGIKNVVNMYGITETANWVGGVSALDVELEDGLIGKMWGGDVAIYTKNGNIVSKGKGEILLKTPSVMTGYYKLPEIDNLVFINGWFRTGDTGVVDNDGMVKLIGREKFEINRAGLKIHPEDIDILLESHPDVKEACAFSIPDEIAGEIVGVAVCIEDDMDLDMSVLKEWCQERLSREKVPEKWFVLPEIPKTDRGKINRFNVSKVCLT